MPLEYSFTESTELHVRNDANLSTVANNSFRHEPVKCGPFYAWVGAGLNRWRGHRTPPPREFKLRQDANFKMVAKIQFFLQLTGQKLTVATCCPL